MNFLKFSLQLSLIISVKAKCMSETSINVLPGYSGLTFVGFESPVISRMSGPGMGNKIVLKDYTVEPMVTMGEDGITVSAGDPCDLTDVNGDTTDSTGVSASEDTVVSSLSASEDESAALKLSLGGLLAILTKSPLLVTATHLLLQVMYAEAAEMCSNSITVEIYTDVDALIHEEVKSGECPAESFYFKHHESVFNGYEGCVGQKYLYPCGQDANGLDDTALSAKLPFTYIDDECVETGYTYENRTFWILWGDPLDIDELKVRTGLNPVVKFPLVAGPYPRYTYGTDETVEIYDDSSTAKAVAKDLLLYIGAITEEEKPNFYVTMTEGAEHGIQTLWAAKVLEIAQTTCNREIYVLMEAPAYGYNNGEMAMWVNAKSSSFYNSTECLCSSTDTCLDPTVKITNVGFFPPDDPVRMGGDGQMYNAKSASFSSPWMESLVFPENPSGRIKIPQLPNASRRVCDGCYVWPMFFMMRDFEIPLDERPECSGWAFGITKGYSASVRAGFMTYDASQPEFVSAVETIAKTTNTIGNGLYSQWSWMGQMQLHEMIMSRPLSDKTSWIGAYSDIMKEKWDAISEGFEDCPVVELTNYGHGAYAFFTFKSPYLGIQDSMIASFFLDVLGIKSTTYYWGFRGADPADYYGEGKGTYDFTRMQLFRDVNVYSEVSRRAKIVCQDTSASIGDFVSIDDWASIETRRKRRLREINDGSVGRRELIEQSLPHLRDTQVDRLLRNQEMREDFHAKTESCAPHYTTSCMFDVLGTRFEDHY